MSPNQLKANKPEPIMGEIEVFPFEKRMDADEAIDVLLQGHFVLIVDFYSSGLLLLNALKEKLQKKTKDKSFQKQRDFRTQFRELSHRILLEVRHHKIRVKKSPSIGWFKILYPDLEEFALPFPQIQGLNSSWQWYENGIFIPVLKRKIHPWFGSYFPTRFEHLEVFDDWLKEYKGQKNSAIDVGIGSGILTFQMLNHGFKNILGTDTNPNALIGLHEELAKNSSAEKVQLFFGDLFAGIEEKTELIVFNPPWLPASGPIENLDAAIYYHERLFPAFFEEAKKHLLPEGRVVLLFSNLAQITHPNVPHPIKEELAKGNRFILEKLLTKTAREASHKTRRNLERRASEIVELWVLK